MIAIGGAIGTGLFLGSGFAIGFAGPSVLVSYGIGAVIALLLMGCLAEMTVAHPVAGSFGAWAEFYIGPGAGFLVRYAYWSCIVFAVGTEVTAIALYHAVLVPGGAGVGVDCGVLGGADRGERGECAAVREGRVRVFGAEGRGDPGVYRARVRGWCGLRRRERRAGITSDTAASFPRGCGVRGRA